MKNLILGCTGVLASLHVFEWGWYLRFHSANETGSVFGLLLEVVAILFFAWSMRFGVLQGLREIRENHTDED